MTEKRPPVQEGDVLAGKYLVERVLGAGGIGIVVAAQHLSLERRVAIKFLLPEILANAEIVERFAREARSAARLRSEHVAQVLDVGELPDGAPFMVMEYLEGCDLSELIALQGPLGPLDAVSFVLQAGEAIAEAHAAGIVHRDLKPANLFLTRAADGRPRIKVLDFGISKNAQAEEVNALSLTSSASVLGTPLYMSPEQMQSARGVDARSDIWSIGAILYELLTGRPPFLAQNLPELCVAVMQHEPTPVCTLRPDVPPELGGIISRCLAKERSRRFGSVLELAYALAQFGAEPDAVRRISGISNPSASVSQQTGGGGRVSAPPLFGSVSPVPSSASTRRSEQSSAPAGGRTRRRIALAIVGGVLLSVLAIGVGVALRRDSRAAPQPVAPVTSLLPPSDVATRALDVQPVELAVGAESAAAPAPQTASALASVNAAPAPPPRRPAGAPRPAPAGSAPTRNAGTGDKLLQDRE